MKKYLLLCLVFIFVGCRPITMTQRYYQEYVNPKPSITYEEMDFDNIPAEFLHHYYDIDSKFVRIVNEIHLVENFTLQPDHPETTWVKYFASFDNDHLFISGDDVIGFDPLVRKLLDESGDATSIFKAENDRLFWLNILRKEEDKKHYLVFELNKSAILAMKQDDLFFMVADTQPLETQKNFSPEALTKIQKSKKYSGTYRGGEQRTYWIRSMAADNLYYFFNK